MMYRLIRYLRTFWRRQDGTATIEFVILFPVFMALFVSVFESGLMMTKLVMLDRGLDITVRAIRLAPGSTAITHDAVRKMICDNIGIVSNCEQGLKVEMSQIDPSNWVAPTRQADCLDRSSAIAPVVSFQSGGDGALMFIRACLVVDPMFRNMGLGLILTKDPSGGVRLVASSAFANEVR